MLQAGLVDAGGVRVELMDQIIELHHRRAGQGNFGEACRCAQIVGDATAVVLER